MEMVGVKIQNFPDTRSCAGLGWVLSSAVQRSAH